MINKIKSDKTLSQFIVEKCCENDICVTLDENIGKDSYVIIKVDDYYNSLNLAKTPPSIDCLIINKCIKSGYGLTLVELKNITTSQSFCNDNMRQKFETTLYDFIKDKFKKVLDLDYKKTKLFFVTNKEVYKRDLGLKLETLINIKFYFNGKRLMIEPKMPTPTIKNCY